MRNLKLAFLTVFREFFVYHHRSLEFRAKFFAAMIASDTEEIDEKVYDTLANIGKEIYGNDEYRIEMLIRTTKEYVQKIITDNGLKLDELIADINKSIKEQKRFVKKINMNHLRRLQNTQKEDVMITQQRILEFAALEISTNQ